MKYYVPSTELSASERRKRNAKNRDRVRKHGLKKKAEAVQIENEGNNDESVPE